MRVEGKISTFGAVIIAFHFAVLNGCSSERPYQERESVGYYVNKEESCADNGLSAPKCNDVETGKGAGGTNFTVADSILPDNLEKEVWRIWEEEGRDWVYLNLLKKRLFEEGDTYALYDFQTYTHNLVSMARRCQRVSRLGELARTVETAYEKLEDVPGAEGKAWICRGGAICNTRNGLVNSEVMLVSAQFLGLAISVANSLAMSGASLADRDKYYISETARISIDFLLRWGGSDAQRDLLFRISGLLDDVREGSTSLLFTDKQMWLIHIYSELSGIISSGNLSWEELITTDSQSKFEQLKEHLTLLLNFFNRRITFIDIVGPRGNMVVADLDRGYWREYSDNRYAAYIGSVKPVVCREGGNGETPVVYETIVPPSLKTKDQESGWDFSHARRLVHAIGAMERNREAITSVWGLNNNVLPPRFLGSALANNLVENVWNQDMKWPLFSNFWNGSNGWYRVAYDNGTGSCREGYPPFGLAFSFPTGGYAEWSSYNEIIGNIANRLYEISMSENDDDVMFMAQYYPGLGARSGGSSAMLNKLMFWPALIGDSDCGSH